MGQAQQFAPPLVGAIDQGTTSSRFFVFDAAGRTVASCQRAVRLHTPHAGWVEQDADELLASVRHCIDSVCREMAAMGLDAAASVACVGIANQRETVVAWDSITGRPIYNAIVWSDTRTTEMLGELRKSKGPLAVDAAHKSSGLPLSPYFSASKIRWIGDNVEGAKGAAVKFGTVDSWLLWSLLRDPIHVTDVTNAHRTGLRKLAMCREGAPDQRWCRQLAEFFAVDTGQLAGEVRSCAEPYGVLGGCTLLAGVPVTAVLGDQHAALIGHACMGAGSVKNTYGTGSIMMCNVGATAIIPDDGLVGTVAFQLGPREEALYALEGPVACGGATLQWLTEGMDLIRSPEEVDRLAAPSAEGVCFIPALTGFLSPRWDAHATGAFVGLRIDHGRRHLVRAVVDAIAFSSRQVFDLICGHLGASRPLHVTVGGGLSNSSVIMQAQADALSCRVVVDCAEATAVGCARAAAIGAGLAGWWRPPKEVSIARSEDASPSACATTASSAYEPMAGGSISDDIVYRRWLAYIERLSGGP